MPAAGRGDFIGGTWLKSPSSNHIISVNPATEREQVMQAPTDPAHAQLAVDAAAKAYADWSRLAMEERINALRRFKRELSHRVESMAQSMSAEMGKLLGEARTEARSLVARIDAAITHQLPQIAPWSAPGVSGECRYHPLGVVGVIGPFNYPLHLCHTHIVPALLSGNTVVMKPSERTPQTAQRYMEAFEDAGLPPVLQMVQGGGDVGRALVKAHGLNGLAFTGSWETGNAIERALADRPDVLVALEMGGQNMAIVLDDADLDQALEGVLVGGFASAGQRCTCTSRVLVERSVASTFISRLTEAVQSITVGPPDTNVFMGPMASAGDLKRFDDLLAEGVRSGAEALVSGARPGGGAFAGPSVHLVGADHRSAYTETEVFGPDLALTIVDNLNHAIETVNASPYGLSLAVFTSRSANFERVYRECRVGCLNWNRSTNRATGSFPFGGFGRSGNFRPAGSNVVHNVTYPVQVQWADAGVLEGLPFVTAAVEKSDALGQLEILHRYEEACDPYGVYPTIADGWLSIDATSALSIDLMKGLVRKLVARGYDAELRDDAFRMRLKAGKNQHREASRALGYALHALRHLHPARFLGRRPPGTHVPGAAGTDQGPAPELPRSNAFLERVYHADWIPRDKKPSVLDMHRSSGPYLASVDADPLVFFDACSQIASQAGGLNPPAVLERLHTGRFGRTAIDTPGATDKPASPEFRRFAAALRKRAPGLPYITFCNSGSEANEVALAIAAQHRPGRRAVVAFKGAFHGRTMLPLHCTWNPKKRLRFEIDGFQARWVPFPGDAGADDQRPREGERLDATWGTRLGSDHRTLPSGASPLEVSEFEALVAVERAIEDDQAVAVIVEPMQAEGGDRYASARFFGHLRLLTAVYEVAFIMDEVQCGFHLGGPFLWHQQFALPEPPDLVSMAKKSQVGLVMSRLPSNLGGIEAHAASAVRGEAHLDLVSEQEALRFQTWSRPRLAKLKEHFGDMVGNPRACGYAFAFDLPSAELMNRAISQRFWRGYLVYGAGERTLRFRLNREMSERSLDALFDRISATLSSLAATTDDGAKSIVDEVMPDEAAPWPPPPAALADGYKLFVVEASEWPRVLPSIAALQARVYEPARRDDLVKMGALLEEDGAQCLVVVRGQGSPALGHIVASAYAFPLECFAELEGPATDPMLGQANTLYSADVTVDPDHRGNGLGAYLKEEQLRRAMLCHTPQGGPRYRYITGRNRVGATTAMAAINARYGAYEVERLYGQYEGDGVASYYRIPLDAPRLQEPPPRKTGGPLELSNGLQQLFDKPCDELEHAHRSGLFNGGLANKVSLANFVSPVVARSLETLRAMAPRRLSHLVLASGRAETVDKGLRAYKFHRGDATTVVSVGPVFGGASTAAARSISLPGDHPDNWFGWPTVADPTLDPDGAATELERTLDEVGAENVLTVVIEGVYEKTGREVPDDFWVTLKSICTRFDVPLTLVETATGGFRNGRGVWLADQLSVAVDAVWWFPGGQLGLAFVGGRYAVKDKLTLISTWDGDEVSLLRTTIALRTLRAMPLASTSAALERALSRLGHVRGKGLYRSVSVPHANHVTRRLEEEGVRVRRTLDGALLFAPHMDISLDEIATLEAAIERVVDTSGGSS